MLDKNTCKSNTCKSSMCLGGEMAIHRVIALYILKIQVYRQGSLSANFAGISKPFLNKPADLCYC